ncbi:MAG TPA: M28 family metallopeptidase [Allosphingosinicella sp.]|jgi:Zn-dependent M28 family amino/carboxypeptidase|nr:M28 family metallopeptidase [Allosphingosinicella sp.]
MRLTTIFSAAVILGGLAGCATTAQQESAAEPQLSLSTLTTATQILSSDQYEGRAPTTPGEERAVNYIAERFQQAGLQPGNHGEWFQSVPLVETTATPTPLRITGGNGPLTFNYRTDMVANTYQVQPRVALDNSEIVFVGYGINAPERGWNDYAGVDVRGKTVIILVNDPDWQSESLEGPFNGRAMTYYGRWTYKYEEAARQGAAAAFIVHETAPAAYGWNVVQSSWTGAQYNMDEPGNHMDQSRVIGWLTQEAAGRLFANSGLDLAALSAQARQPGFRPVPLRSRASISLQNQIRRQASRNVIGVLPGRTRPDEYVIYTAHWDHLGRCDADETGDDICNGAVDNASGTAGLIALAEAHVRAGAPDRTLIFLAVTAEESGLLGSRYYAEHPIFPLAQTAGGINMDSLSLFGDARDLVSVGAGKSELDAYLRRAAAASRLVLRPEPAPEAGYYYRSDHFSLARQGVPMLYPKLGEDLVNGGVAAGHAAAQDYRANRYHQPSDEYNPSWDWTGALRELGIFYRIGRELAMSEDWPNWNRGDEFRAIRDRSRAGQ